MAQPQYQPREDNHSGFTFSPKSDQQFEFALDYLPQSSEPFLRFSGIPQKQSMSQQNQSHFQAWQQPQQMLTPPSESRPMPTSSTGDYTAAYAPWGTSMYGYGFAPGGIVGTEPVIMPEPETNFYTISDLLCGNFYAQDVTGKAAVQFSGRTSWPVPGPVGYPSNTSASSSDLGSTSSFSPKSYASDHLSVEVPVTTPTLAVDLSSTSSLWASGGSSYYQPIKASPPKMNVSAPQVKMSPVSLSKDVTGASIADVRQTHVRVPKRSPSSGATTPPFKGLPVSPGRHSQYGYSQAHSQRNVPDAMWYAHNKPSSVFSVSQGNQAVSPSVGSASSGYVTDRADISQVPMVRSNGHKGVATQAELQGRFHAPKPVSGKAVRNSDDEILLQGKRDGLTYKEISKKLRTKCAESTLRGRYRSLTKEKRDRVRKPVWREIDVSVP